jgi:tetratricopeptide (TPR) repeat protein
LAQKTPIRFVAGRNVARRPLHLCQDTPVKSWSAVLALILVTFASSAAAQEIAVADSPVAASPDATPAHVVEARQRIARGEALFERGDFDSALAEFDAAYEVIGEHPSRFLVLYNIGQCHELRFRYDVARTFYQRYLDEGGREHEGYAEVETTLRELGELLSRVTVRTSAENAALFVDGRRLAEVPGAVMVPAGVHVLSVRAPGYVAAEQSLAVPAAGELELTLDPTRLSEEFRGISPAYSLTFVGIALVATGVGIGFGVNARNRRDTIDTQLADPLARWDVTDASFNEVRDLTLTADVLFASAGVAALTALILGILGDWSFGRDDTASVRLTPTGVEGAF